MSYESAYPKPSALIESLRSVGYSLATAIADVLDNSITADANNIWINFFWDGMESHISILDDGRGMNESVLKDAMRPGTTSPTNPRDKSDLGRFGLGLKTASFSQCRQLTVWSKADGGTIFGRRWDLDYVVDKNEWLLQKDLDEPRLDSFFALKQLRSGTLVIWEKADRIVEEGVPPSEVLQKFHQQINDVRSYLEMIFHRHLTGRAAGRRSHPLLIYINGNLLQGWDPFSAGKSASPEISPIEEILYKGQKVRLQGFVMPHKDRLNEQDYLYAGGPHGWIAQQGFYIYRNDRMILAGDWLRLGRGGKIWVKEEQYKLARLCIDIGNETDLDWSLDVKKSTARPPLALRERLTGIAEAQRKRAKAVFLYRGAYGPKPSIAKAIEKPWMAKDRAGSIAYKINRNHPLIKGVLERLGPLASEIESLFRLVEETVPVQQIWIDTAESERDHAVPYAGLSESQILADMKKTYDFLRLGALDHDSAVAYLLAVEPFNRYPELAEKLNP